MAHFARLDDNNNVTQVIVVANAELIDENGQESESKGAKFCADLLGGRWIQTSYNANFRKHFAGAGMTYDSERDAFICQSPYPDWILNEATCRWESPIPIPTEGGPYYWDSTESIWKS